MNILSDKNKNNKSSKIEIAATVIDMVKQLTKKLTKGSADLDTIESNMTEIFQEIRKQATKELIEEKDPKELTCNCGCKMKIKEKVEHTIIGLSRYRINRRVFNCSNCKQNIRPLDEIIGCTGRYTLEVKSAMAMFGQRITFEESSYFMEKFLKVSVSHELIQEFVEKIGKSVAEDDKADMESAIDADGFVHDLTQNKAEIDGTAYLQMDGTMINTREESWKEVRNGMLFRHKDLVITDKNHTKILKKEYYSVFNNDKDALNIFLKTTTQKAFDFSFHKYKNSVILGDGATWIWNYATKYHPNAVQILDYYHANEYLGNAFKELPFKSELDQKEKKDYLFDLLWNGEIIKIISYFKTLPQTDKISRLITYFENNSDRMDYGQYREKGFQIGSGSIESAHKIITQVRMKQAGMRWAKVNVQSIVSLRCKFLSGQWDTVEEVYLKAA